MKKLILLVVVQVVAFTTISISADVVDSEYNMSDRILKTDGYVCFDDLDTNEISTYDEMVNALIENEGLTKNEAQKLLDDNFVSIGSHVSARDATYRIIRSQFEVNAIYKPTLNLYCQTSEGGGSFRGILKILNVGMNRVSNGLVKSFHGTVFTHIQDPNRINWIVNGDFFDDGTTTVDGGVSISLDNTTTTTFEASSIGELYKYCYKESTENF